MGGWWATRSLSSSIAQGPNHNIWSRRKFMACALALFGSSSLILQLWRAHRRVPFYHTVAVTGVHLRGHRHSFSRNGSVLRCRRAYLYEDLATRTWDVKEAFGTQLGEPWLFDSEQHAAGAVIYHRLQTTSRCRTRNPGDAELFVVSKRNRAMDCWRALSAR